MSMRSVVVALLAGALCAWAGQAEERPCATDSEAADDGGCVAAEAPSMIQARSTGGIRKGGTSSCKKLAVFFDGTKNELNKPCEWGQFYRVLGPCETNVAALWRLAREVPETEQLTHYEPGVATSGTSGENFQFGIGTKSHMLNVYTWLARNYEACGNQINVIGFSRGALSARMLQGMIHHVGLAKPGHINQAKQIQFGQHYTNADAAEFKASDKVRPGVQVNFLGLFDTILRTLLSPYHHSDIASFHMQLTSSVMNFAHALAVDEGRETYEAAELYVHPSTNATQVWFLGEHNDVGGGWKMTGIAQIAGGWMADQAVAAGLHLPSDWSSRSSMAVNYKGDTFTERGLPISGRVDAGVNVEMNFGLGLVRNPLRCRGHAGHPFRNQRVKFHKSVADRMQGMPGWVPLPFCCGAAQQLQEQIDYVTNDHYEARKAGSSGDQWVKVSIGWVRDVNPTPNWEAEFGRPEYLVRATGWSDEVPLPSNKIGDYDGCCTVVSQWPAAQKSEYTGPWWAPCSKASQRFNRFLVLPLEPAVANAIVVEVQEDDLLDNDHVGKVKIRLSASGIGQMKRYTLSRGGKIEVKVERIASDANAKQLLPGSGPAQCRWLKKHSGMDQATFCNPTPALWGLAESMNVASSQDCEGFIRDIKTGA